MVKLMNSITVGDLLSITLQRPTYSRLDRESATTIFTYSEYEFYHLNTISKIKKKLKNSKAASLTTSFKITSKLKGTW